MTGIKACLHAQKTELPHVQPSHHVSNLRCDILTRVAKRKLNLEKKNRNTSSDADKNDAFFTTKNATTAVVESVKNKNDETKLNIHSKNGCLKIYIKTRKETFRLTKSILKNRFLNTIFRLDEAFVEVSGSRINHHVIVREKGEKIVVVVALLASAGEDVHQQGIAGSIVGLVKLDDILIQ